MVMEEKKKSNKKGYFLFVIIYLLLGVLIYFGIKKYYKPSDDYDDNTKYIIDAVEIEDDTGLLYSLDHNKDSYALIYGSFMCVDTVYDLFLGSEYSYIKELTIDESENPEIILNEKETVSNKYSIYGIEVNGINFDSIAPNFYKSIKDIRHKNIRYDYYIKPTEYTGTMLVKINNDNSVECIQFYKYKTINSFRQDGMHKTYLMENTFIVLWLVLLFMILMSYDPDSEKFEEIKF